MKSLPSASIVIPTFNRLGDLERVVRALQDQRDDLSSECQIVVVDDGSTDGTSQWLGRHALELGVTTLRQENTGPAGARNRGVDLAHGDVVLFLGDDTVPQPGWLLEHLEAHRIMGGTEATAVLGYTSFPASADSPFLRWINEYGAQFGYALIDDVVDVPFNFFYTSNISIRKQVLVDLGGFRDDFPAAAWEDIEFSYRATREGLRLRYLPRARTIHYHQIRIASFARRQKTSGLSAAIFAELHPELEGFLGVPCIGRRTLRDHLERAVLQIWIDLGEWIPGVTNDRVYRRFFDGQYLEGLEKGLNSRRFPLDKSGSH